MKLDLFADGVDNVTIANGVVRVDFYIGRAAKQPSEPGGKADGKRETHLSVNLPLSTFVNSMNVLQRVMAQLVARGVVSAERTPQQADPPGA